MKANQNLPDRFSLTCLKMASSVSYTLYPSEVRTWEYIIALPLGFLVDWFTLCLFDILSHPSGYVPYLIPYLQFHYVWPLPNIVQVVSSKLCGSLLQIIKFLSTYKKLCLYVIKRETSWIGQLLPCTVLIQILWIWYLVLDKLRDSG